MKSSPLSLNSSTSKTRPTGRMNLRSRLKRLAGANYVAEGKDPLRAVPCQADAKQKGVQAHTGSFQNQRQTQALQAALNAYSIGSGSHTSIPAESFLFRPCRGCMTV